MLRESCATTSTGFTIATKQMHMSAQRATNGLVIVATSIHIFAPFTTKKSDSLARIAANASRVHHIATDTFALFISVGELPPVSRAAARTIKTALCCGMSSVFTSERFVDLVTARN